MNLTVAQAAHRLNVSTRTVYRLIDDPRAGLKSIKIRGARRIPISAIEEYERAAMRRAS